MLQEAMQIKGKITGLIVGLFFGPIGMIIGLIVGHLYDSGVFNGFLSELGITKHTSSHTTSQVFFDATFSIMGYVAKSDGRVSEQEIAAAREVMSHLGLSTPAKERAMQFFYHGKQPGFDVNAMLTQLRQTCAFRPMLLRTFVEYQVHIAHAEGVMTPQKRAALQTIYTALGLQSFNFHHSEQQSRAQQNYQRYYNGYQQQQNQSHYTTRNQLQDAYKILNVTEHADKEDVKKAYRRLMSQNHPDKLVAKGLPPEMIKIANQKTDQIKKAYEMIKSAKGW